MNFWLNTTAMPVTNIKLWCKMGKSKSIDITNRKFGRLTALYKSSKIKGTKSKTIWKWMCECDCGKKLEVVKGSLLSGNTRSCGCLSKDTFMAIRKLNRIEMIDKTFGLLTIKRPIEAKTRSDILLWECECTCGNKIKVSGSRLRSGKVTSCGCQKKKVKPRTTYKLTKIKRDQDIGDFVSKFFPNEVYESYSDTLRFQNFKDLIKQTLRTLWKRSDQNFERNYYIFEQLYLSPSSPTLQELGDKFNLSRERVRQLESKSLDYLKKVFMT